MPLISPWFHVPRPLSAPTLRLLCFPYAGGSATEFHHWPASLPEHVELCAVQLPGRGARLQEPPLNRVEAVLEALEPHLLPLLDRPFVVFGHSMGAFMAFDLVRRLRRAGRPLPAQLLVSGARAPHLRRRASPIHHLPHDEFVDALRRRYGTPEQVLQHEELLALLMPALRADFEAVETWSHAPDDPLPLPITAFGGHSDHLVTRSDLDDWGSHTTAGFHAHVLVGGHFFINTNRPALLRLIAEALR